MGPVMYHLRDYLKVLSISMCPVMSKPRKYFPRFRSARLVTFTSIYLFLNTTTVRIFPGSTATTSSTSSSCVSIRRRRTRRTSGGCCGTTALRRSSCFRQRNNRSVLLGIFSSICLFVLMVENWLTKPVGFGTVHFTFVVLAYFSMAVIGKLSSVKAFLILVASQNIYGHLYSWVQVVILPSWSLLTLRLSNDGKAKTWFFLLGDARSYNFIITGFISFLPSYTWEEKKTLGCCGNWVWVR